jgi:hypothetical protein
MRLLVREVLVELLVEITSVPLKNRDVLVLLPNRVEAEQQGNGHEYEEDRLNDKRDEHFLSFLRWFSLWAMLFSRKPITRVGGYGVRYSLSSDALDAIVGNDHDVNGPLEKQEGDDALDDEAEKFKHGHSFLGWFSL